MTEDRHRELQLSPECAVLEGGEERIEISQSGQLISRNSLNRTQDLREPQLQLQWRQKRWQHGEFFARQVRDGCRGDASQFFSLCKEP